MNTFEKMSIRMVQKPFILCDFELGRKFNNFV